MNYYIDDIFSIDNREELIRVLGCEEPKELYCFFADPASHSLSPKMYNTAFEELDMDRFYFASKVPSGKIGEALDQALELGIKGFNVSMPHKVAIVDYLDNLDLLAELCGAVNTVVMEKDSNGRMGYKGYNTDVYGFAKSVEEAGLDLDDLSAVVLGLGGAGKAAVVGLASNGAAAISVFVRRPEDKDIIEFIKKLSYYYPETIFKINALSNGDGLKEAIQLSQVLANCTSVGMGAYKDESLVPSRAYLHENLTVVDVIYAPAKTKLLEQAEMVGCKSFKNGSDMLLYQGEQAFSLYTGEEMPIETVRSIFEQ